MNRYSDQKRCLWLSRPCALFLAALVVSAVNAAEPCVPEKSGTPPAATASENTETKWGIAKPVVRVSTAGYMIDFRYKVLDPDKAAPLVRREYKPCLIDQATKAKLLVPTTPKVGSLRQKESKLTPGRTYCIMFANPAQVVKAGSKVTVVIGDCRLENLTVE